MAQELLTIYKAEVDQYVTDVNKAVQSNLALGKTQDNVQKELNETTKAADKLGTELAGTARTAKSSSDNLKGFSKTAKSELTGLSASARTVGLQVAGYLGLAFTTDAAIQFGKASVNAFLEAQENAEKLRFTITQVGGESEAAFQRLIDQSEQLQNITVFSDDSIQQAQAALSTFGLTANQIEELLPKLADFASVTKTDIVSAANQVGAGLQGAGREFKKFGIEVSASATPMENLTEITKGFVQFQGAASKETETLTGKLKQQQNAADELQEALGERLAPVFVQLKTALFEAALGILGFNKAVDELEKDKVDAIASNFEKAAEKIRKSGGDIVPVFEQRLEKIRESNQKIIEANDELAKSLGSRQTSNLQKQIAREEIENNNEIIRQNEVKIRQIEAIIDREKGHRSEIERTLTAEQLRGKSLNELNKLLEINQDLNDAVSQSNVQLIEKEITARQKQSEELKKELAKQLEVLKKLNGDVQKLPPLDITAAFDEEAVVPVNPVPLEIEPRIVGATEFNDGIEAIEAKTFKGWVENNDRMLTATEQLVNDVAALYDVMSERQIDAIERSTEKQLELLNTQSDKNSESLKKRRISETEFAIQQEKIEKEKVRVQEETDKKIRAIKRKQAIADKAAALIAIAINTAKAYAETLGQTGIAGLALGELIIAAGLAQAAVVAAQPIPYKKGSKDTGGSGHLALVGEEGPELVHMRSHSQVLPSKQTKTYGEAINAMFDNRFDQWAMSEYLPRLLQSSPTFREQSNRKDSFAENVSASTPVNFSGLTASQFERFWRNGSPVTNADHIGKSVAKYLKEDIYRR